jgi:pimeloyl-[acyl-carrier protein] methyl ester esterase
MASTESIAGLHLRVSGSGPPLLMIHGWAMSGRCWRFQEPLADRWHLLMPDLPGHGFSPAMADLSEFTVAQVARTLLAVLDARNVGQVAVMGWSLGSLVALRLAELLGDRLTALVLVGGTPRFCSAEEYPHGLPAQDVRGLGLRLRRDYGATLGDFFKRMFAQDELDHDQYQRIVREVVLGGRQPTLEVAQAGLQALAAEDVRSLLPAITAPALILHGMADTISLPGAARYLADHLPCASLQLLPGVGHAPFLTRPEEFNTLVAEFLDETSPR